MSTATLLPAEVTLTDLLSDGLFVDGDWIESKDQDPDGDVRLIQLADVGDGVFRNRSSRFLTSSTAKELRCTFLEPGDILVARMPEPLGRACIFPGVGQPAVTAVDVCIIRPNAGRVLAEWLELAINSPDFRESMQQFVRGTTRQRISRKNLGTLQLQVPDIAQQLLMTDAINRLESSRSSTSDHIRSAQHAAVQIRQAVLAAACSGRLTADWRELSSEGQESARSLVERSHRSILARKQADEAWSQPQWLDLPSEWIWAPMRDLGDVRGGIQKQPKRAPKNNAHPYLRVANVLRGRLDLREISEFELFEGELATYHLEPGDLLVVEGNGSPTEIGRAAIWTGEIPDCVHQNHIIRVRCPVMNPQFVEMFWNSPIGSREIASLAVTSAGLYSLSTKKIGAMPVPVPPITEQEEIVRRASTLLSMAGDLLTRVEAAGRTVDRSSQAILASAFRGELSLS